MIKLGNNQYILHFCELGDIGGDLYIEFHSIKKAIKRQKELMDESMSHGYYTEILKKIEVRRREPDEEKDQVKKFEKVE